MQLASKVDSVFSENRTVLGFCDRLELLTSRSRSGWPCCGLPVPEWIM